MGFRQIFRIYRLDIKLITSALREERGYSLVV